MRAPKFESKPTPAASVEKKPEEKKVEPLKAANPFAKPQETKPDPPKAEHKPATAKPQAQPAQGDDFKNSLAALIGKGKPTYKKKPEPVVEEPKDKKKVDVFADSSDSDAEDKS